MGREVLRGLGPDLLLGQHSVVPVSVGGGGGGGGEGYRRQMYCNLYVYR